MDEDRMAALEERVQHLYDLFETMQDDLTLQADTFYRVLQQVGYPLDEADEDFQHIRQMAAEVRARRSAS